MGSNPVAANSWQAGQDHAVICVAGKDTFFPWRRNYAVLEGVIMYPVGRIKV
ncbi:MAG: hypothetical protein ACETWG_01645 [Candidatus Neomarinimicrobiota bacterium]